MPSASWTRVACAQDGVIRTDQLHACGRSNTSVADLVSSGQLTRICRGVFRVAGAPPTWRAQLWTSVLATDGTLCLFTAGQLWDVYRPENEASRTDVLISHSRRVHAPPATRVLRSVRPRGSITEVGGLPVTSRAWTVLDLLAVLPSHRAGTLADRALQRGWLSPDDVARRLREHPRRAGNSRLRAIAAVLDDGAAAHSERVLHQLLRSGGITGWVPNYPVWNGGELVAVVDVAFRGARLAIEVDGMAYHVDVDRFRGDRTRQNALVGLGWTVLRFTWADLIERPGYVLASIRRLLA